MCFPHIPPPRPLTHIPTCTRTKTADNDDEGGNAATGVGRASRSGRAVGGGGEEESKGGGRVLVRRSVCIHTFSILEGSTGERLTSKFDENTTYSAPRAATGRRSGSAGSRRYGGR